MKDSLLTGETVVYRENKPTECSRNKVKSYKSNYATGSSINSCSTQDAMVLKDLQSLKQFLKSILNAFSQTFSMYNNYKLTF